jgi:hypothetical protein
MTIISRNLEPGCYVLHRNGTVDKITDRKDDDSGWWVEGGGGLADYVLERTGDWIPLTPETVAAIFEMAAER